MYLYIYIYIYIYIVLPFVWPVGRWFPFRKIADVQSTSGCILFPGGGQSTKGWGLQWIWRRHSDSKRAMFYRKNHRKWWTLQNCFSWAWASYLKGSESEYLGRLQWRNTKSGLTTSTIKKRVFIVTFGLMLFTLILIILVVDPQCKNSDQMFPRSQ